MQNNKGEIVTEVNEKTTWAKRIFAITLFVEDLEACKPFYQKVFELPITFADDEGITRLYSPSVAFLSICSRSVKHLNLSALPVLQNPMQARGLSSQFL